ncbi:MAG: FG-GAP-like repeat-containing protein [Verrucomicrobiota bacterium]
MVVPAKLRDRFLVVANQVIEYGEPDQLLLNDGKGHFTAVSWTGGAFLDEDGKRLAGPPLDWGLTATFRDLNQDGAPDLYVCNDYWTPDRIWINNGKGSFRALDRLALRETPSSSMGVDFADIDRDGHLDFIVTDMLSRDPRLRKRQMPARWPVPEPIQTIDFRPQIIQNTLFHNRGDGTYEEVANYSGVAASEWTWQPLFLDVDLDGFPDLLVSAGHARDVQDVDADRAIAARQHSWKGFTNAVEKQKAFTQELMVHMRLYPRLAMPLFAFRNAGQLQFQDVTELWGTSHRGVHHSMALADLDNDGDLDLVVNNFGEPAALYRNESSASRVSVRLRGVPPNTAGIGARVALANGAIPLQTQEVICGGSYMAGSDPLVVFAAGSTQSNMTLTVHWRSGRMSQLARVAANRLYEIEEAGAGSEGDAPAAASPSTGPLFSDASVLLQHVHHDDAYDDLARQSLLPRKLSQLGPGVAWGDLNQDGWDDLLIGAGRGGQMAVFINDKKGAFTRLLEPPLSLPTTRDQTAVLTYVTPDGHAAAIAGSSNYEDGLAAGPAARLFDWERKAVLDTFAGQASSSGPLCLADLDGDNQLDLFVGGRCLPGRYPQPASSLLFRQNARGWELDNENTRALRDVGLISSALWSDLDGDGSPELILACEWGPIRVFKNLAGRLTERTAELGLAPFTGWWTSVATGDLDGDGRLDIVAGNWGLNSTYRATAQQPLRLYYGDLARAGGVELLEAEYDARRNDFAPRRRLEELSRALPFLAERFASHKAFSEATIKEVVGPDRNDVRWVEAKTLASMAFFNRGDRFEPVPLPAAAQWAPVYAVVVADYNGDGKEDLFLGQNCFDTEAEVPRQDAGRGLLLLGQGGGKWETVPGQQSGIRIYGQQRGAAVGDFNQDGRADLVVAQNNAPTILLQNKQGQPGLRIRLRGPKGNPDAIGASLRLLWGDSAGPVREIQSGSGYWSQNSSVQILARPQVGIKLWVRWPGGKQTTNAVPAGAAEIAVDGTGRLTVVSPP